MWKIVSMFCVAGAASVLGVDTSWACGGGGGGCGMSGGGGYRGGRAVASRKAMGGGANLAQARPQAVRSASPTAPAPRGVAAVRKPVAMPAQTVAVTNAKLTKSTPKKPIYTCPMHPQIQWTSAVDCPICGMKLKLKAPKKSGQNEMPMNADEHAGMEGMDMEQSRGGMSDMEGMDDMMCCPGCMGTGGMSGMKGGNGSSKASGKASSRSGSMGGMGSSRKNR